MSRYSIYSGAVYTQYISQVFPVFQVLQVEIVSTPCMSSKCSRYGRCAMSDEVPARIDRTDTAPAAHPHRSASATAPHPHRTSLHPLFPARTPYSDPLLGPPAQIPCSNPLLESPARIPCSDPRFGSPAQIPCSGPLLRSPARIPYSDPLLRSPARIPCSAGEASRVQWAAAKALRAGFRRGAMSRPMGGG